MAAVVAQGQVQRIGRRHDVAVVPGRLAVFHDPLDCHTVAVGDIVFGAPQADRHAIGLGNGFDQGGLQVLIVAGQSQTAGQVVEVARLLFAFAGLAGVTRHLGRQRTDDQRGQQHDGKGDIGVGIADLKAEERLHEEEVEGSDAQYRGEQRWADAEARRRDDHAGQVDQGGSLGIDSTAQRQTADRADSYGDDGPAIGGRAAGANARKTTEKGQATRQVAPRRRRQRACHRTGRASRSTAAGISSICHDFQETRDIRRGNARLRRLC